MEDILTEERQRTIIYSIEELDIHGIEIRKGKTNYDTNAIYLVCDIFRGLDIEDIRKIVKWESNGLGVYLCVNDDHLIEIIISKRF